MAVAPGKPAAAARGAASQSDAGKAAVPTGVSDEHLPADLKIPVVPLAADGDCGIDRTKAEVVEFVAETAGLRAAAASGLIVGSVGGVGISLGAFGKISIGDNKMLMTIVKTGFNKIASRVAYEASYRALSVVKINTNTATIFTDLVQQYIDGELKKHAPKAAS